MPFESKLRNPANVHGANTNENQPQQAPASKPSSRQSRRLKPQFTLLAQHTRSGPLELKRLRTVRARHKHALANVYAMIAEIIRKQSKRQDQIQDMERWQANAERLPAHEVKYFRKIRKRFVLDDCQLKRLQEVRAQHEYELAQVNSKIEQLCSEQPKRKATVQLQGEPQLKKAKREQHSQGEQRVTCIFDNAQAQVAELFREQPKRKATQELQGEPQVKKVKREQHSQEAKCIPDHAQTFPGLSTVEACGEVRTIFTLPIQNRRKGRVPCTGKGDQCTCVCTHDARGCSCWSCEKERFQVWWPKTCVAFVKLCEERKYEAAESLCRQMLKSITKSGSSKLKFRHQTQLLHTGGWIVEETRHDVIHSLDICATVAHLAIVMVNSALADQRSLTKERLLEARELLDWLNERLPGETDQKESLLASLERATEFVNGRLREEHFIGAEEYDDTVFSKIRRGLRFVFDRMFA